MFRCVKKWYASRFVSRQKVPHYAEKARNLINVCDFQRLDRDTCKMAESFFAAAPSHVRVFKKSDVLRLAVNSILWGNDQIYQWKLLALMARMTHDSEETECISPGEIPLDTILWRMINHPMKGGPVREYATVIAVETSPKQKFTAAEQERLRLDLNTVNSYTTWSYLVTSDSITRI